MKEKKSSVHGLRVLFMALMSVCALVLSGGIMTQRADAAETTDGDWTYSLETYDETSGCFICGYSGSDEDVEIPSTISDTPVIGISENAFSGCNSIESITIPSTVKVIESGAFCGCPVSKLYVDEANAIYYDSDANIVAEKKTGTIVAGCVGTDFSAFDDSITEIGCRAFANIAFTYTGLEIPEGIKNIYAEAFYGCNLKAVTFPSTMEYIWRDAFASCVSLAMITFNSADTDAATSAFSGTIWERGTIANNEYELLIINGRLKSAEACYSEVVIPEGTVEICDEAFMGNNIIEKVTIPEGVTSIGDFAFEACTNLSDVSIPSTVNYIGEYAFSNTGWAPEKDENGIAVINDLLYDGSGFEGELDLSQEEYSHITAISPLAFRDNVSITSVNIPDGVSIGDFAFYYCTNLKNVVIGEGVSDIGFRAFDYTQWLQDRIEEDVLVVVNGMLLDGTQAENHIIIPRNVNKILDDAFVSSTITAITIGRNVTFIGSDAFTYCDSLTAVYGCAGTLAESFAEENGYIFNEIKIDAPVVSTEATADGIKLSWDAVIGAETYSVYRKSEDDNYELLEEYLTEEYYTDKNVASGTEYSYYVVAYDKYGVYSDASENVEKIFLTAPEVTAPETVYKQEITISWSAVTGAEQYIVYRDGTSIDIVNATTYTDTDVTVGSSYSYCVSAICVDSNSANSAEKKCKVTLAKPTGVTVTNGPDGVIISWDEVECADEYLIRWGSNGIWGGVAGCNGTEYVDTTGVSGVTYQYQVCAVNCTYFSDFTASETITYIASPKFTVEEAVDEVHTRFQLNWDEVTGADTYVIYRWSSYSTTTELTYYDKTTSNSYLDKSIRVGANYKYMVYAVSGYGTDNEIWSGASTVNAIIKLKAVTGLEFDHDCLYWDTVSGVSYFKLYQMVNDGEFELLGDIDTCYYVPELEYGNTYRFYLVAWSDYGTCGPASDVLEIVYLNAPTGVTAYNTANGIYVSWDAAQGATGYLVYRESGDTLELVGSVTDSTTYYSDSTAGAGDTYMYYVKSVNGNTVSGLSDSFEIIRLTRPVIYVEGAYYDDSDCVRVTWDAVAGADFYYISRYDYSEKTWEEVAVVNADEGCQYIDYNVVAGGIYGYSIYAKSGDSCSVKSDEADVTLEIEKSSLAATYDKEYFGSSIFLDWLAVDGGYEYIVYRKTNNGAYEILTTTSEINYIDSDVEYGNTYRYYVKAHNTTYDTYSAASTAVSVAFIDAPELVSATNTEDGISLKWNTVEGATGYLVYRKLAGEASATLIATVEGGESAEYLDTTATAGINAAYIIKATGTNTAVSRTSASLVTRRLEKAVMEEVIRTRDDYVKVTWDEVAGATKYLVYRYDYSAKAWKKLATVTNTEYVDETAKIGGKYAYTVKAAYGSVIAVKADYCYITLQLGIPALNVTSGDGIYLDWCVVDGADEYVIYRKTNGGAYEIIGYTTELVYTDSSVEHGNTYRYCIKAHNTTFNTYSVASNAISVAYIDAPKLASASNTAEGINLKWNSVEGATSYLIYRKLAGGTIELIATVEGDVTEYLDTTAVAGVKASYVIKAAGDNARSAYSNSIVTIHLEKPVLTGVVKNAEGGIDISWEETTGATKYAVYRYSTAEGWVKLAVVTDGTTYTDTTAETGVTYAYAVKAAYGSVLSVRSDYIKIKNK